MRFLNCRKKKDKLYVCFLNLQLEKVVLADLPVGAQCRFEEHFLSSGCIGWHLKTYYEDSEGKHYDNNHFLTIATAKTIPKSRSSARLPLYDHSFGPALTG